MIADVCAFRVLAMCSKVNTRLALARLRLQSTKRQSQLKPQRKEIAKLLDEGKEVTARALTEQLIRDEKSIQAYSQLDIFCEQFLARLDAITRELNMPKDLIVCLCTLVYAAPRVDVEELKKVAANLELRYGTLWADSCHSNLHGQVHPQVFSNLGIGRSSAAMVDEYMVEIANEFEIDWRPLVPTPTEQEFESTYRAAKGLSVSQSMASPKTVQVTNGTNSANQHFPSPSQTSLSSASNQHHEQHPSINGSHPPQAQPSAPFHEGIQTSSSHSQPPSSIPTTLSGKSIERSLSPPIEFVRLNGFVGGSSVEEELVMIEMLPNVPDNMAVSMDRVPIASEGGVIVTHEEDEEDGLEVGSHRTRGFRGRYDTSHTLDYNDSSISITDEDIYDEIITWEDIPDGPVFETKSTTPYSYSSSLGSSTPKRTSQATTTMKEGSISSNSSINSNINNPAEQQDDPLLARFNRLKNGI